MIYSHNGAGSNPGASTAFNYLMSMFSKGNSTAPASATAATAANAAADSPVGPGPAPTHDTPGTPDTPAGPGRPPNGSLTNPFQFTGFSAQAPQPVAPGQLVEPRQSHSNL